MTKLRQREFRNAKPGLHFGTYAAANNKEVKGKTLLQHAFDLDDETTPEGEPLRVTKLASLSYGLGSTNRALVNALLGYVPREVDLDQLIGRRCRLQISHRTDANNRTWDQIDSFLPMPADPMPATPPPARVGFLFDARLPRQTLTHVEPEAQ